MCEGACEVRLKANLKMRCKCASQRRRVRRMLGAGGIKKIDVWRNAEEHFKLGYLEQWFTQEEKGWIA